jgi:hypothetical protein
MSNITENKTPVVDVAAMIADTILPNKYDWALIPTPKLKDRMDAIYEKAALNAEQPEVTAYGTNVDPGQFADLPPADYMPESVSEHTKYVLSNAYTLDLMNNTDKETNTSETSSQVTVLATQFFMSTSNDFDEARRELFQLGIKTSYNDEVMIFSTQHSAKNQITNTYAQESNGLILERDTWKPLVVPPRSLRFNIDTEASNRFLHQGLYHIYKAEDGTCFNMYYRSTVPTTDDENSGRWIISTAKGYDMNNTKWDGITYQEIVTECLSKIGLTWETFTSQLNKTYCYSFGFKHPSFHKFFEGKDTPIYKIWFIQSVDLNVSSSTYLWASDKSPVAIINNQEVYSSPVGNLRELYKLAGYALNDFLGVGSVCYGFILRSANFEQTEYHSDLFIESNLMRTIRKYWYENNIIDQCHKNGWSKEKTITLHSYLDTSNYELFRLLFKQYTDTMESYSEMLNTVTDFMVRLAKDPSLDEKTIWLEKNKVVKEDEKYLSTHDNINHDLLAAKSLLQSFKDTIRYSLVGKSNEQLKKVFHEYSCHPSSLEYLI